MEEGGGWGLRAHHWRPHAVDDAERLVVEQRADEHEGEGAEGALRSAAVVSAAGRTACGGYTHLELRECLDLCPEDLVRQRHPAEEDHAEHDEVERQVAAGVGDGQEDEVQAPRQRRKLEELDEEEERK